MYSKSIVGRSYNTGFTTMFSSAERVFDEDNRKNSTGRERTKDKEKGNKTCGEKKGTKEPERSEREKGSGGKV